MVIDMIYSLNLKKIFIFLGAIFIFLVIFLFLSPNKAQASVDGYGWTRPQNPLTACGPGISAVRAVISQPSGLLAPISLRVFDEDDNHVALVSGINSTPYTGCVFDPVNHYIEVTVASYSVWHPHFSKFKMNNPESWDNKQITFETYVEPKANNTFSKAVFFYILNKFCIFYCLHAKGCNMTRSKVAVLRTTPETVLDDYEHLCELAGMKEALDPSTTTILKDNISWHLLFPSANTTPWQLEGTIIALRNMGFSDLVNVHNKTVVTIADLGDHYNKFGPVLKKYNVPVKYNFKDEDMKWIKFTPKTRMAVLDKIYPDGLYIPDYFIGKNIVHLPTVKTHSYTVTTGAMKNAFGGLLNVHRHYTHTWIHDTLVDLLAIQKEIHSGIFCTMDGTTAGSGPGPRTLIPHQKDIIIASSDQVAVDAVSAMMMGFDPMKIPYIVNACERGLGEGDPRSIDIVGMPDVAKERWNFKVGFNLGTGTGMLLWRSPLRIFQNLFFQTPVVCLFIFASELYHDRLWYPLKGRRVVSRWLEESPWGRLFGAYPE